MSDNGLASQLEPYKDVIGSSPEIGDGLTVEGFVPFRHHVLVEPLPPRSRIGSIEIPEAFREQQAVGWVRRIHPEDLGGMFRAGDLVMYATSAGSPVTLEGRDMLILQYHSREEGDILGHWPAGFFENQA
jgi:hypothetical protein